MKALEQTRPELVHLLVSDELWELIRQIVPVKVARRQQGGGRRRADGRQALAAIVYVASTGRAWRQIPEEFGLRWPTVYRRFAEWRQAHVWTRLLRLIADHHDERVDMSWSRRAIGAVYLRAAQDDRGSDRPVAPLCLVEEAPALLPRTQPLSQASGGWNGCGRTLWGPKNAGRR